MKRYNYNNKIGMYADDNGDWCRVDEIEKLKCCGNCKHQPSCSGIGELEPLCQFEDTCNNYSKWQSNK